VTGQVAEQHVLPGPEVQVQSSGRTGLELERSDLADTPRLDGLPPDLTGSFAGATFVFRTTNSCGTLPAFVTLNETNECFAEAGLGRTLNSFSWTLTVVLEGAASRG
jgi:hypothetical protein